jgi:hypothetical protein
MKKFYLMRHIDVHGNSGVGVVAEGIIFGDGTGSFTWITKHKTVTTFLKVKDLIDLHNHEGRTEIVIEGTKKNLKKFEECDNIAHDRWAEMKVKKITTKENS